MIIKPGQIIVVVGMVVVSMMVWEFKSSLPWYIIILAPFIAGFIIGKLAGYVDNTIERGD